MTHDPLIILCALLLNIALGSPRCFYARLPVTGWLAQSPALFMRWIERKLNRDRRSLEQRHLRGVIMVTIMMIAMVIVGWIADIVFKGNFRFVEIALLALLLPVRSTWDLAAFVAKSLNAHNVAQARTAFEGTLLRHYMLLDEHGLARASIEMLAVNFSEKIVAPILWYLVFGLPGFLLSKTMYLMVETLRPLNDKHLEHNGFCGAAVIVHYWLHWAPARVVALLWPVACVFPPSADPFKIMDIIIKGPVLTATPQTVSVLAAASSLSLSLGGPTSPYTDQSWQGKGTVKVSPAHIKRAQQLFALLNVFLFVFLGLVL